MGTEQPIALRERAWAKPNLDFISGRNRAPVPQFPLEKLGPFWQAFCENAANEFPRDYYASNLLGAVSVLLGNRRHSALPAPFVATAPATLWLVNTGIPSHGKSYAYFMFSRMLENIEADFEPFQFRTEDATIAGTVKKLSRNPMGVAITNDELSGWWDAFKFDRQGEQFWLKAWNGRESYTLDRGSFQVKIPIHALPVLGNVQPSTLPSMLAATKGQEKGFTSRILFVFPDKIPGQRPTGKAPDLEAAEDILRRVHGLSFDGDPLVLPVSRDAAKRLAAWDKELFEQRWWVEAEDVDGMWLGKAKETAQRLALVLEVLWWASCGDCSPEIIAKAKAMAAMADPARNSNEAQRKVAQTKLEAFCAKHGLDPNHLDKAALPDGPQSVSLRAMEAATLLMEDYFFPHFERACGDAFTPVNTKAAIALVKALVKKDVESFNSRELRQYGLGKVHPALHGNSATETVNDVCQFLVDLNVLRRAEPKAATGRKPQTFEVNSLLATLAKRALAK